MSPVTHKSTRRKAKRTGGRCAGGAHPFRERREVAGLTLNAIAKQSGISMLTVQRFELDKGVSSRTASRLSEIYGALPGPMRPGWDLNAVNAAWLRDQVRTFVRERGLTVVDGDKVVVTMRFQDVYELCRLTLTVGGVRIVGE